MKVPVVIFLFGAVFLCANASIIEHIYNSTHLRGNVKLNTDNGIKLGYDGSLRFKNHLIDFQIAKIGANFNAAARPGAKIGNTTNATVDYSGSIHLSGGGSKQADIAVNGTARLKATYNKSSSENGSSTTYTANFSNSAKWTASAGDKEAKGKSLHSLSVNGTNCYGDGKAGVHQKFRGAQAVAGTYKDGNESHTFGVLKYGTADVKKKIYINQGHSNDVTGGALPSVGYKGIAGFKKTEHVNWDNTTVKSFNKGGSLFGGLIWAEGSDDGKNYIHKIKHAKNADFGHKGETSVNGELKAVYGGVGTVGEIESADLNVTKDLTSLTGGLFKAGNLHYAGVVKHHPKEGDREEIEKEVDIMRENQAYGLAGSNVEEVGHHHDKIKTFVKADWAAGKGVEAKANDDGTIDVDSHGGVVWKAVGVDTKHKKPWHKKGGFGFNSTFEIDPNQKAIRNVQVQIDQDAKVLEEFRNKFQGIDMIARQM